MDLQYDTEHNLLRDSAERFLAERYGYKTFQEISSSEAGWSPEIWAEIAELGWLGLPFSEEDGGFGGGPVETSLIMEAMGKNLVIEPYLPTVVLAGGVVAALGSAEQKQGILAEVAAGESRLAFAYQDGDTPVTASRQGDDYVLSGTKKAVLGAPMADMLFVSAQEGPNTVVFGMPSKLKGITRRSYRMMDGPRAADIEFNDVTLPAGSRMGDKEDASAEIAFVLDAAIAAVSADAVGAIEAMVAQTVEYTSTRQQFGQPLSKFQVLAHRMVEMKVREEEARASALLATLSLDGAPERRVRAVSGAKAKIGRNARFVHQAAIQTHGAIGTTDELSLGGYAKRLVAYEINFGSTREHLRRYSALIADPEIAGSGLMLDPAAA